MNIDKYLPLVGVVGEVLRRTFGGSFLGEGIEAVRARRLADRSSSGFMGIGGCDADPRRRMDGCFNLLGVTRAGEVEVVEVDGVVGAETGG